MILVRDVAGPVRLILRIFENLVAGQERPPRRHGWHLRVTLDDELDFVAGQEAKDVSDPGVLHSAP